MGEIITSRENAQKVLKFGTVKGFKTLISAIILVKNDETVSFDGDVLIKQKMLLKESVATKWQRIIEEQRAILGCYSGTKEEVIKEMKIAIPFIEDLELKEMTEDLLVQIEKMRDGEFADIGAESMMDIYGESEL